MTLRTCWAARSGTARAFFRGNGTNVIKIAPETAIKLSCNDRIKRYIAPDLDEITPLQRMVSGALAGCVAQACAPALHACAQAVSLYPVVSLHAHGLLALESVEVFCICMGLLSPLMLFCMQLGWPC